MRKMKGDSKPFPTTVVVKNYLDKFVKDYDIVLTFPGYMGTTQKKIDDFYHDVKFANYTYFTVGMNGKRDVSPGKKIQEAHNDKFSFKIIGLRNTYIDHAKMMFFLENNEETEVIDVNDLLNLKVKAVLIGSSNQSYTTYSSPVADKGEADILLIDGNSINREYTESKNKIINFYDETIEKNSITEENRNGTTNYVNENLRSSIAIFEDIKAPEDFLQNIFKETIQKLI